MTVLDRRSWHDSGTSAPRRMGHKGAFQRDRNASATYFAHPDRKARERPRTPTGTKLLELLGVGSITAARVPVGCRRRRRSARLFLIRAGRRLDHSKVRTELHPGKVRSPEIDGGAPAGGQFGELPVRRSVHPDHPGRGRRSAPHSCSEHDRPPCSPRAARTRSPLAVVPQARHHSGPTRPKIGSAMASIQLNADWAAVMLRRP